MTGYLYSDNPSELDAMQSGLGLPRLYGNGVVPLGDSRMAATTVDGSPFGEGRTPHVKTVHFLNMAVALNDGLFSLRAGFGRSGWRSDQYLTYLDDALAVGAQFYPIFGVANDIAQASTTGDTALTIVSRIRDAALKIVRAGRTPILFTEPGGNAFTAEQITMMLEINQRLCEFVEGTRGALLFDMASIMWDLSSAGFALKAGYTYDGLHLAALGSVAVGEAFGNFMRAHVNPLPALGGGRTRANGFLANPLFLTVTGGSLGTTGFTGSVPASFSLTKGGTITGSVSVVDAPDGRGKALQVDIASGAAGGYVSISQDATPGDFSAGDLVEFGSKIRVVSGANNLRETRLNGSIGGEANPVADGYNAGLYEALPASLNGKTLTLRSLPFKLVAGFSWVGWQQRITLAANGSAQVLIWNPTLRKRFAW